ncbi:MAG TPA: efflux RND transporter periplasmic adaptor subunit [Polyangia bacterium]|nr:efflux RND transporter periplasmic adaptor subunit [Polyangia bacterium]
MSEAAHDGASRTARRLAWVGAVALLLAMGAVALLFWRHHREIVAEAARRRREVDRGPRVFVAEARLAPAFRSVTLPGDVRGFLQSTVYAKLAGYVKSISVDKGDHVRAGQVLGVLESPEVDQQVAAAEADLLVKRRTFERYQQLVKKDFVSTQDFETARAQYEVSSASLAQVRALRRYGTLRAPFAGVVTARYVDPGALVPAATGSTESALPLVDVADLRRLRIQVFVQQDLAPFVHAGDGVQIVSDQQPELRIGAPLARCANALDPRTRTMLCEVWLDGERRLYPGTFVHVTFRIAAPPSPLVDSTALVLRDDKPAVAIVRDGRLRFVTVRPGLDDGKKVQIVAGLRPGERVVLSPPAELADGDAVQVIERQEGGARGGPGRQAAAGEPRGAARE